MKLVMLAFALLAFLSVPVAADIKAPKKTPVPSTESQAASIREGVALHDKQDFEGAIRKYSQVLAENSDNIEAYYELGFSYFASGNYPKSLETALRGAEYKSDLLAGFYTLIGNSHDELGRSKEAIEAYKFGLKQQPDNALLHYNLGISHMKQNKVADAKKSFKLAASYKPNHSSTHFALASLLYGEGYRTPALLASFRFLTREPATERSETALKFTHEMLRGGVSTDPSSDKINITLNVDGKTEEGDFTGVDLMLGLTRAVGMTEKNQSKTEAQLLVDQVESFFTLLSEMDAGKNKSKFTYRYYVPYFVELQKRGLVEPFVYYTHQRSGIIGVDTWLKANDSKVREFLAWSEQYRWPTDAAK